MITITLKLPEAYDTLACLYESSARAVDAAGMYVADDPDRSLCHSRRAEALQSVAKL